MPSIDLIGIGEAARILGLDPRTVRRHLTRDNQWCRLYGQQLRAYNYGGKLVRFNRSEVERVASSIRRPDRV